MSHKQILKQTKIINQKKLFVFIFFLTFSIIKSFATGQNPDKLIYKGDTLSIFANPLEQLYETVLTRPKLFGNKEGCLLTACWRGYEAEWKILNDQLYLTRIISCCFYEDSIQADLHKLFGSKFINGKVKAEWVNANIIAPQGKELYYVHDGYGSLYEKELELQFKNGQLIGTKMYDNSKSRRSIYSQNDEKLAEFIYSNINWIDLPKLDDKVIRVHVLFSANENGVVDSVKLIKGYDTIFDKEAIRVVKAIPEWDVFYRHEKLERRSWTLPIFFSNDNKKKYYK